ncbi:23812_t:CDS:1, partial [Dentiscutata erythropus]
MVNGLTKKAIQTGLDASSGAIQELKNFINKFITKHAPKKRERMNTRQLEDDNEVNSS